MKKIYIILTILFIIFALISPYFIEEQNRLTDISITQGYNAGPYGEASQRYAMVSCIFMIAATLVGVWGIRQYRRLSLGLIISSLLMIVWSLVMFNSPRHISVSEVIVAWYAYMGLVVILSLIGVFTKATTLDAKVYQDDILDDFIL